MFPTARLATAAILVAAALSPVAQGRLHAQTVLISEVEADGADRWVEVHNRGTTAVDLSTWTLHYASRTPLLPQIYWWGFPSGTTLAANGYLRVHWYTNGPTNQALGEFYTGTSPFGFLFGYGGEPLAAQSGALALFSTQSSSGMGTATWLEDWVSWGDHDFPRESLAVAAGLWTSGAEAPAIPPTESLARNPAAIGVVASCEQQWFLDPTPTPLQPNLSGAMLQSYGTACAPPGNHLLGAPALSAPSLPLLGNPQFGFAIGNTTGIYGEFALLAFSAAAAPPGLPSVLPPTAGGCAEAIDPLQLVGLWLVPTQVVQTPVPMSLAGQPAALAGAELHVQALVLDLLPFGYLPYQGISNALRVVLGQ